MLALLAVVVLCAPRCATAVFNVTGVQHGATYLPPVRLRVDVASHTPPGLFTVLDAAIDGEGIPMGTDLDDARPGLHNLTMVAVSAGTGVVHVATVVYTLLAPTRFDAVTGTAPEWGLPPFEPQPLPRVDISVMLGQRGGESGAVVNVGRVLVDGRLPVVVAVDALVDVVDAVVGEATLAVFADSDCAASTSVPIKLHRGLGHAAVSLAALIQACPPGCGVVVHVHDATGQLLGQGHGPTLASLQTPPPHALPSTIVGNVTVNTTVALTADTSVAAGAVLTVAPGGAVLAARGTVLRCATGSRVHLAGVPSRPVTVAGVTFEAADGCTFAATHSIMGGTGGLAPSPAAHEHHDHHPALRLMPGSRATLAHAAIVGGSGQGIAARFATLSMRRCLVADMVAGGELQHTDAVVDGCAFVGFPSQHPSPYADVDNDAVYIYGGHVLLFKSSFGHALDDCVDSGTGSGGALLIVSSTMHSCAHEGVALSNNGADDKRVVVHSSVISNCQQGVEMGFSTPRAWAWVIASSLEANGVAVRYADAYGWPNQGFLHVQSCRLLSNRVDVMNLHRGVCGAVRDRLLVVDTVLSSSGPLSPPPGAFVSWGNAVADPERAPVWDAVRSRAPDPRFPMLARSAVGGRAWGELPHDGAPRDTFATLWSAAAPTPLPCSGGHWFPQESLAWAASRRAAGAGGALSDAVSALSGMCGANATRPPPPPFPAPGLAAFEGPTPESHVMVLWSLVPLETVSAILAYVDAHPTIALDDVWLLAPGDNLRTVLPSGVGSTPEPVWRFSEPADAALGRGRDWVGPTASAASSVRVTSSFSEDWYHGLYGDTYYNIYHAGQQVSMTNHKGRGPFFVLQLTDTAPRATRRPNKGIVNANMLHLKETVRRWLPNKFQVHASQTAAEGAADGSFLLGRFAGVCRGVAAPSCGRHTNTMWLGGRRRQVSVAYHAVAAGHPLVLVPLAFHSVLAAMYKPLFRRFVTRSAGDVTGLFDVLEGMVQHTAFDAALPREPYPMEVATLAALYASKQLTMVVDLPEDLVWMQAEVPLAYVLHHTLVMKGTVWVEQIMGGPLDVCLTPARVAASADFSLADDVVEGTPHGDILRSMAANVTSLGRSFVGIGRAVGSPLTLLDGNHRVVAMARAVAVGAMPADLPAVLVWAVSSALDCDAVDRRQRPDPAHRCAPQWCRQ